MNNRVWRSILSYLLPYLSGIFPNPLYRPPRVKSYPHIHLHLGIFLEYNCQPNGFWVFWTKDWWLFLFIGRDHQWYVIFYHPSMRSGGTAYFVFDNPRPRFSGVLFDIHNNIGRTSCYLKNQFSLNYCEVYFLSSYALIQSM